MEWGRIKRACNTHRFSFESLHSIIREPSLPSQSNLLALIITKGLFIFFIIAQYWSRIVKYKTNTLSQCMWESLMT